MSGGHYGYAQYRLQEIAETLNEDIAYEKRGPKPDDPDREYWIPYKKPTLDMFETAFDMLHMTHTLVQRIDWLLSADDGEETFHERVKEELEQINCHSKLGKTILTKLLQQAKKNETIKSER